LIITYLFRRSIYSCSSIKKQSKSEFVDFAHQYSIVKDLKTNPDCKSGSDVGKILSQWR